MKRGLKAKTDREYQRDHRAKKDPAKKNGQPRRSYMTEYSILVAWSIGDLSEGQASELLGVDRIEARGMQMNARAVAARAWTDWRKQHPPQVIAETKGTGN